jgi:primosomal protein N'
MIAMVTLPNITLVGVILADVYLNIPDFRHLKNSFPTNTSIIRALGE